jgi:hypothetical protein
MTNRLFAVTFDCADSAMVGGFWARALGRALPGRLTAETHPLGIVPVAGKDGQPFGEGTWRARRPALTGTS